jgi:DMSO/TMAO reductase YedYZ molybdopterin-dependent catalytic subunit
MRHTLIVLVLLLVPLGSRADDKKTDPLKVENEKGKETTFTAEAIAKLPRQTLKVKDHKGNPATYEGVPLADVLRSANVTLGKDLKGPLLANFLLVEAADGYRVVFALPEVDPDLTDKIVLLADRKDGKPLAADDGPYKIIAPGDKRNMRWVKRVTRISVRSGAPAAKDK